MTALQHSSRLSGDWALSDKLSPEQADLLKSYERSLVEKNLPCIFSPAHFSYAAGFDHEIVRAAAFSADSFYREFSLQNSKGKIRRIAAPLPSLLHIQRTILRSILYKAKVSEVATAYLGGASIKKNAAKHVGQQVVLSIDVKDFFPSIKRESVEKLFHGLGYNVNTSRFLSYLCCLRGSLPQGAATSGALANLILTDFDAQIEKLAEGYQANVTRYADDITFSGSLSNRDLSNIQRSVTANLSQIGMTVNRAKTRISRPYQRQKVTGVVVNQSTNPVRARRLRLRQEMYYVQRYGIIGHTNELGRTDTYEVWERLLGEVSFQLQLRPSDQILQDYKHYLIEIVQRDVFPILNIPAS